MSIQVLHRRADAHRGPGRARAALDRALELNRRWDALANSRSSAWSCTSTPRAVAGSGHHRSAYHLRIRPRALMSRDPTPELRPTGCAPPRAGWADVLRPSDPRADLDRRHDPPGHARGRRRLPDSRRRLQGEASLLITPQPADDALRQPRPAARYERSHARRRDRRDPGHHARCRAGHEALGLDARCAEPSARDGRADRIQQPRISHRRGADRIGRSNAFATAFLEEPRPPCTARSKSSCRRIEHAPGRYRRGHAGSSSKPTSRDSRPVPHCGRIPGSTSRARPHHGPVSPPDDDRRGAGRRPGARRGRRVRGARRSTHACGARSSLAAATTCRSWLRSRDTRSHGAAAGPGSCRSRPGGTYRVLRVNIVCGTPLHERRTRSS